VARDGPPDAGPARSMAKLPIGAAIQARRLELTWLVGRRIRKSTATQPSSTVVPRPDGSPVALQRWKFAQAKATNRVTSRARESTLAARPPITPSLGARFPEPHVQTG